jgi:Xaa-Pro aminopeptidase
MLKNLFLHKIDAFLIESPQNRYYFSGFQSGFGYILLTQNSKTFYTDSRYFDEAQEALTDFTVKKVSGFGAFEAIKADLKQSAAGILGYEDGFITVGAFKNFKSAFSGFNLKPASDIINSMRLVKTSGEIEKITAAQRLAERVFSKVTDWIKPGVTEKEVKAQFVYESLKAGADGTAFDPIVAFGENSAVPHHAASDREFIKGEIMLIDFGVNLNGYCSDMTRTFYLYDPNPGDKNAELFNQIYDIVLNAQNYALKHIRAGMTAREADSLAREYIRANGYDSEFGHSLGHGIGIDVHEAPFIRESGEEMLLPGTVITVEPGIYIKGFGGVRIEDMVVVRENGAENLTLTDKKFIF